MDGVVWMVWYGWRSMDGAASSVAGATPPTHPGGASGRPGIGDRDDGRGGGSGSAVACVYSGDGTVEA